MWAEKEDTCCKQPGQQWQTFTVNSCGAALNIWDSMQETISDMWLGYVWFFFGRHWTGLWIPTLDWLWILLFLSWHLPDSLSLFSNVSLQTSATISSFSPVWEIFVSISMQTYTKQSGQTYQTMSNIHGGGQLLAWKCDCKSIAMFHGYFLKSVTVRFMKFKQKIPKSLITISNEDKANFYIELQELVAFFPFEIT